MWLPDQYSCGFCQLFNKILDVRLFYGSGPQSLVQLAGVKGYVDYLASCLVIVTVSYLVTHRIAFSRGRGFVAKQ